MRLSKREARIRRHRRVRAKIRGTAERPRIAVCRTNRHVSAQAIDDKTGRTLAAVTSVTKDGAGKNMCNRDTATRLGKELGAKMQAQSITHVVFDRGGCVYHGIVKAFADGLRSADEKEHFHF